METGSVEFELKLTGAPADIAILPESSFIAAIAPHGGLWERLSSSYFDTPEGALAAHGLSLRLREEGAALVQAVKQKGANPAERQEYETDIARMCDFPARTGASTIDALIDEAGDALVSIAETTVDRWRAEIWFKGAQIELAVDHGRAVSRDGKGRAFSGPLAEVELELLSGPQTSVFEFAKLLIANASLRLAVGSKLEKALALKDTASGIPKSVGAKAEPEMTGADVLGGALVACAARMASLQPAILDLRLVEGVHQMRVALRRLRATERIFRRHLKTDDIKALAEQAKLIASSLGPARDWDVFLEETLPAVMEHEDASQALRGLKARAEAKRAQSWAAAAKVISGEHFARFLIDLMEAATVQAWRESMRAPLDEPVGFFAEKALDRALKKAIETAEEIGMDHDLSARHPLRIALKKLRYPLQIFRDLYPKEQRRPYMAALSALQDAFGAINDAVVAQELADVAVAGVGEGGMRAAGFIAGYKAAQAQAAAKRIDADWAAFEKTPPFWRD